MKTLPVFLLGGMVGSSLIAGDLPVLVSRLGSPVVPELMGGCSMKCVFPWKVESTPSDGSKAVRVTVVNDEKPSPAWTDPLGVGARLDFVFPKKIPAEMEGNVPFYGLDIINGDWSTEGSPRIRIDLSADGIGIGRRRIARIMRQQRIFGRSRKLRNPRTTHSNHDYPIDPNLL